MLGWRREYIFDQWEPTVTNSLEILPKNLSDCIIFDSWIFQTFLSVRSKLCEKLRSLLRIMFDDNLQVTSVASFIGYLNSLSCTFTLPYWVYFVLMPNTFPERVYNTFTAVCEKLRIASFMIKNIVHHPSPQPPPAQSRFLEKFIWCMVFGSESYVCVSLKSVAIVL